MLVLIIIHIFVAKNDKPDDDDDEEYDEKPKFKSVSSSEEDEPSKPDEDTMAGFRKRPAFGNQHNQALSGGVGNWEKHTKGIGAKLLLQVIL